MEILADTEITRRSGCSADLGPATLPDPTMRTAFACPKPGSSSWAGDFLPGPTSWRHEVPLAHPFSSAVAVF
jgi:hypothetical protein